jgi:hypothetical protein
MAIFRRHGESGEALASASSHKTIAERIAELPLLRDSRRGEHPALIAESLEDGPDMHDPVDTDAMRSLAVDVYEELYGPNPNPATIREHEAGKAQAKLALFGPNRSNWPL